MLKKHGIYKKMRRNFQFHLVKSAFGVVRMKGLEPPLLTELDPKSSAATNYATCAKAVQRYKSFPYLQNILHFFCATFLNLFTRYWLFAQATH